MAVYSDLNSINPTTTQAPRLFDEDAVYQQLYNLFGTVPGEVLFVPEFGIDLEAELFELITSLSEARVFNRVVGAVELWVPQCQVNTRQTQIVGVPDENAYDMDLWFGLPGATGQLFLFQGRFTP